MVAPLSGEARIHFRRNARFFLGCAESICHFRCNHRACFSVRFHAGSGCYRDGKGQQAAEYRREEPLIACRFCLFHVLQERLLSSDCGRWSIGACPGLGHFQGTQARLVCDGKTLKRGVVLTKKQAVRAGRKRSARRFVSCPASSKVMRPTRLFLPPHPAQPRRSIPFRNADRLWRRTPASALK